MPSDDESRDCLPMALYSPISLSLGCLSVEPFVCYGTRVPPSFRSTLGNGSASRWGCWLGR